MGAQGATRLPLPPHRKGPPPVGDSSRQGGIHERKKKTQPQTRGLQDQAPKWQILLNTLSLASRDGSQTGTSIHHGKRKSSQCSTKSRHGDLFNQGSNKTREECGDGVRHEQGLGKADAWRVHEATGMVLQRRGSEAKQDLASTTQPTSAPSPNTKTQPRGSGCLCSPIPASTPQKLRFGEGGQPTAGGDESIRPRWVSVRR